jgi:hypothetical protein
MNQNLLLKNFCLFLDNYAPFLLDKKLPVERKTFFNPLKKRSKIRAFTCKFKGVYIWIGKKDSVALLKEKAKGNLQPKPKAKDPLEIYVGASYTDLYKRLCHYYCKHRKPRPVVTFLQKTGLQNCSLVVYRFKKDYQLKHLNFSKKDKNSESFLVVSKLEFYIIQLLKPSLNIHLSFPLCLSAKQRKIKPK